MKVYINSLSRSIAESRRGFQLIQVCIGDFPQGLKMLQKQFAAGWTNPPDVLKGEACLPFLGKLAAIPVGETMRFILDTSQQPQQHQAPRRQETFLTFILIAVRHLHDEFTIHLDARLVFGPQVDNLTG